MTDQIEDQDVELDEEIEEAHDPKNAEAASVASVDKAGNATKKAPARKGDKNVKDEPAAQGVPAKAPQQESVDIDADFSDDLNALVESEATLSEGFKEKAAVIFEAAIKSKLSEEVDRLEAEYQAELQEEITRTKEDLVEKVDSYLNYVVEQWMEDNKLAIQSGLRTEIAENFMGSLKDLFVESYIEVPESKVDLVDELATANEELEEQANAAQAKAMELAEQLEGYKRAAIIAEASKDLADTQAEKLAKLCEDVDFGNEETFASKVATIKESYFSKKSTQTVTEEIDDTDEPEVIEENSSMATYINALRKTSQK